MVVSLGPGKFYGSSLPRPRFYTDVKHNSERVDPPVPVLDPLLQWASEAHWSMGGLSFKRLRLQGRIEGNVERLRSQREKLIKDQAKSPVSLRNVKGRGKKRAAVDSPSPPRAPIAAKRRRRYVAVVDDDDESEEEELEEKLVMEESEDDDDDVAEEEEEEEEEEPVRLVSKKKPARKLYEEFNRVADKRKPEAINGGAATKAAAWSNSESDEAEGGGKKGKKVGPRSPPSGGGTRTSPRLAKAAEVSPGATTRASRRLVKRG